MALDWRKLVDAFDEVQAVMGYSVDVGTSKSEAPQASDMEREVSLAMLRELFGGPPPERDLAMVRQRWEAEESASQQPS